MDSVKLMIELVEITGENWLTEARFTELATKFVGAEVARRIEFLTGVKTILRDMPVKVFPDLDARQSILGMVQAALDKAIDVEEAQAAQATTQAGV